MTSLLDYLAELIRNIDYSDMINMTKFAVDISIVSYIIYKIIIMVKDTRAGQLVKGLAVLVFATQLTGWLGLNTINFILRNTMTLGVMAILIVFQPELRAALERIGRSKFGDLFSFEDNNSEERMKRIIDEVVLAVENLSKTSTGALIAFERETKLGDVCNTGTEVNAVVASELLENIFFPNTPLHDGAVIIGEGKIKAAGCFLPLTENRNLSHDLGTRHRAGLGISENSDTIVVIVSEETGRISIAYEGILTRNLVPDTLKKALTKVLIPQKEEKKSSTIWKGRNIWKRIE